VCCRCGSARRRNGPARKTDITAPTRRSKYKAREGGKKRARKTVVMIQPDLVTGAKNDGGRAAETEKEAQGFIIGKCRAGWAGGAHTTRGSGFLDEASSQCAAVVAAGCGAGAQFAWLSAVTPVSGGVITFAVIAFGSYLWPGAWRNFKGQQKERCSSPQ